MICTTLLALVLWYKIKIFPIPKAVQRSAGSMNRPCSRLLHSACPISGSDGPLPNRQPFATLSFDALRWGSWNDGYPDQNNSTIPSSAVELPVRDWGWEMQARAKSQTGPALDHPPSHHCGHRPSANGLDSLHRELRRCCADISHNAPPTGWDDVPGYGGSSYMDDEHLFPGRSVFPAPRISHFATSTHQPLTHIFRHLASLAPSEVAWRGSAFSSISPFAVRAARATQRVHEG